MKPGKSAFVISIARTDAEPVRLKPGSSAERDLVESIVRASIARGVGMFRTEATVAERIREAVKEVLHDLKSDVVPN